MTFISKIYSFPKIASRELNYKSIIILTIKGKGYQNILSEESNKAISLPNRLQINDENELININSKIQYLPLENNTVKMEWDNPLTTCRDMFKKLSNITKIDLTNFDFTQVNDMGNFFDKCGSVQSINISNGNGSLVRNMDWMCAHCGSLTTLDLTNFRAPILNSMKGTFYGCGKLKYLDLSNFRTTSVVSMEQLFQNCYSLISLDLSNFYTEALTTMWNIFYYCQSLVSLDIRNMATGKVTSMDGIFFQCWSLKSLNLSHFDTRKVNNMNRMFYGCRSLEVLNLSSFETDSVTNMRQMFLGCSSLKILDLKNFNPSNLESISSMFEGCYNLEYLDISNFKTDKVQDMSFLFNDCYSLKYIDLSNFDTALVTDMTKMFRNCYELTSMNISSFSTASVKNMSHMFSGCISLQSLELTHFETPSLTHLEYMFYNCSSLNYLDISSFCTEKVNNYENMFHSTSSLISLNLSNFFIKDDSIIGNMFFNTNPNIMLCYNESKMISSFKDQVSQYENICNYMCNMENKIYIPELQKCVDNCYYSETEYRYKYQKKCYKECPIRTIFNNASLLCEDCLGYYNYEKKQCFDIQPDGYYINDTDDKTIKKCPYECKTCTLDSVNNNNLCTSCNVDENYYHKLNDSFNINSYYKCYHINDIQIHYYLEDNIFKPCYSKCKTCNGTGTNNNNNCLLCEEEYILINGNCKDNLTENKLINTENIYSDILSESIEPSQISGEYRHIYTYQINTNQEDIKNNITHTYIEVDQQVFEIIKNKFDLKDDDKVFVAIFEKIINEPYSVTMDYIYEYFLENETKLNMSCFEEEIFVNIYVPIINLELAKFNLTKEYAKQGYDIYNKNDIFYNDQCAPANYSDNDIILEDRKKDIYPNNITLCKSYCKYTSVNIEEQRVICSCNLNNDKIVDNEEFIESDENFFTYFLDYINYKIFKCYKLFFDFNNLKECYPFYILIITFMFIQVFNCIYLFYSLKRLKIELGKEMLSNKRIILDKISKLNKRSNNKIVKLNKKKNKGTIIYKNKKSISNNVKNLSKSEKNTYIFLLNNNTIINNGTSDIEHLFMKPMKKKKESFDNIINEERDSDKKESNNKNDKENINELPYSKAIQVDKRNIFIIFYSILIDKLELLHIISSDNKIKIILFEEFVISLVFNFFINSLLYTDDIVSNKYHNNGELDLVVTLTLSLLSNIITSKFCYYTKYTSGIDEKIELIVDIRYEIPYYINLKKFFLYLKLKFILFFIFQIFIFAISSYYIVIFCILYSKSRKSLIINYCYSLIESIITDFGISLIILVTRKIGLVCLNKELYNFSKFINYKF